jgi:hypothetical protein
VPRSIRTEPRDGTTIDLGPRNSKLEARYYFLILGSSSLGKENSEVNGRGPYTVIHASPDGAITVQDGEGKFFKVNGQRLKVFVEPFNSKEEVDVINLIDFHFLP